MPESEPRLLHPKYRPEVDGLRAVAVLSVVGYHAFPGWMKGGFIGVDVFFVISGFLISTLILESLDQGRFSFADFYARRVRRIFPALVAVLAATLTFGWLMLVADQLNQLGKHIASGAGFISNLMLWSEAGYFDPAAETKPLLHLWSLGIEEQFYLFWPLALWLTWRYRLNVFLVTAVLLVASFALNIGGVNQDQIATFYSPVTRLWELLSGALLAWVLLYRKGGVENLKGKIDGAAGRILRIKPGGHRAMSGNVLALLGLLLITFALLCINEKSVFPGLWAIIPVLGAVLIILAGTDAWPNRVILSNKVAVWFGLISFPLYLWHWPILSLGRIFYNDLPPREFRLLAVLLSILLAWITYRWIERPFRIGSQAVGFKVATLCGLLLGIGIAGIAVYRTDFSQSHTYEKIVIKSSQHGLGYSLAWYRGQGDWLFLGDAYNKTVSKLKLAIVPDAKELEAVRKSFAKISEAAARHNTRVVLIVGSNKSSIYPEYLPRQIKPSPVKYSSFFLNELRNIPNLTVYDPEAELLKAKETEGILYWMTDTHWNFKGAYIAYAGFTKLLDLPVPQVEFRQGKPYSGGLIRISKLVDFPLHPEDNWDVVWKEKPVWIEEEVQGKPSDPFPIAKVTNPQPLSDQYIWVVGDSFTSALRPYLNATFKKIDYLGHWSQKLDNLAADFEKADKKPALIVIVRVERSF